MPLCSIIIDWMFNTEQTKKAANEGRDRVRKRDRGYKKKMKMKEKKDQKIQQT